MTRPGPVEYVLRVGIASCLVFFLSVFPASSNAKYSAMVVDGHSGKMIYGKNVDSHRYPASVTKVMTLYVVFEELRAGRLKKSTKLKVSKYASNRPPSRLGLKPGHTISVDHAIKALVTKSANDIATVIAEHIGGSEAKFAKRMTATARRLGMSKTTFRNPHGLPDKRQKTTARDLIRLSTAIERDFPKLYRYFSTSKFSYRGRTYRNHNKLLGRFMGTTGIKTGYTRASGFNLTAIVKRGDKKVIAVVMGGKTGRSRDAHMRKIITRAFPKVVAFSGPRPVNAPPPGRKPGGVMAIADATALVRAIKVRPKAPTPLKPFVVAESVAAADQPDGLPADASVIVMQIAAAPPRNRELPLAEPISRPGYGTDSVAMAAAAPAAQNGGLFSRPVAGQDQRPTRLGYAPDQGNSILSGIAALIANSTASQPVAAEKTPAPETQRRIARLILPPSSTIDTSPAATAPAPVSTAPVAAAAAPVPPRIEVAQVGFTKPAAKVKVPETKLPDGYQIQVGAYATRENAEDRIDEVRKAARRLLSKAMGIAMEAENDGGTFYRARFAGLAKKTASRTCKALKKRRIACIVLAQ